MDSVFINKMIKKLATKVCHLLLIIITMTSFRTAHAEKVSIISSGSNFQKSISENIEKNLNDEGISTAIISIDKILDGENNSQILITIGNKISTTLKASNISKTQIKLVSNIKENYKPNKKNEFYLSMTQSICRQFAFIRAIDSKWKTISILMVQRNSSLIMQLNRCAKKHGLTVTPIIIDHYLNVVDALKVNLPHSDVLLALPDTEVYNAKTIKSILLTTYRHRKPLIGYSESFVRAGALAALHSSIDQLGKQVAEITKNLYQNKTIDKQYFYPEKFEIFINKDVAKSLGITIPGRKVLIEKMTSIQ